VQRASSLRRLFISQKPGTTVIEKEKKKRARNDKIRKKLEKQANEIGMTLKPREPTDEEHDEHSHVEGEVYRHPTDASLVWTAQPGRKPNWLSQLLREGHKLEDLRVQSADVLQILLVIWYQGGRSPSLVSRSSPYEST
jgi:DNA-binding protein H-NS